MPLSGIDPLIEAELQRLERLARLLDASVQLPFTRFRIGVDSLVGLLPGVGDLAMVLVSLWIFNRGRKLGACRSTQGRMLVNIALDLIIGAVPVAGDLFDAAWKANLRNVRLLREDFMPPAQGRKR